MGVSESKCVNLAGQAAYLEEAYTVIRTSGKQETGWLLTSTLHRCSNHVSYSWRPRAHAYLKKEGWALSLHNGDQEDAEGKIVASHCCGWRPLGTFWPTRLTGDQAAIDTWQAEIKLRLEELAEAQGLPWTFHEHTCVRGDGLQCSGCFWEKAAKEGTMRELLAGALAGERPPTPPPAKPAFLVKPLPDPMSSQMRGRILEAASAAEVPTDHGCGYFEGAPWDLCHACEYEKDPSSFHSRVRKSQLIELVSAYFRDVRKGELVRGWNNAILERVVSELDTPRDARTYTDEQICNPEFVPPYDGGLFSALRQLNA